MLTCSVGSVNPYWPRLPAFSSISRSELSEDNVESMLETASWSAAARLGPAIFHLPAPSFASSTSSPPFFLMTIAAMSPSWKARIFGGASAEVLAASPAGLWWLDQSRVRASAAKTTVAIIKPRLFILRFLGWSESIWRLFLTPPPPHRYPCEYHRQRQQELTDDPDPVKLSASHCDPPVFLLFWTDGDQIFIRGQPVNGVQREVSVAVKPDERICGPRRTAHHHKSALRVLLAGVVGPRSGQCQRTLFIFRVVRINFGRTQVSRCQAALGRAEQFFARVLSRVLDLQRPRDWKARRRSFHFVHNRVSVIATDQGHLRAAAYELPNRVQVQDQVLVHRDAPALQKTGKRIVVGYFRPAHFQGGVEQEQRAAAILNILLDRVNFRLLILAGGAAGNQHRAIAGNLGLLQQADRFRVVVIFAEKFFETGIPASISAIDLMFPAAGYKTNGPGVVLQIADDGAGDAFLGHALGFFLFHADLNESGAVILHPGCAHHLGVLVHIHILAVNPP